MNIDGVEYIKVHDPVSLESGWAVKSESGKIILDNNFERISWGSELKLADDGYTIESFIDRSLQQAIEDDKRRAEEKERKVKELEKYVGKKVKTKRGIGSILEVEERIPSVITRYTDGEIRRYSLETIREMEPKGQIF